MPVNEVKQKQKQTKLRNNVTEQKHTQSKNVLIPVTLSTQWI